MCPSQRVLFLNFNQSFCSSRKIAFCVRCCSFDNFKFCFDKKFQQKKHKMLGFGGDCFLGRKLNGRIREGGFHQSKLICVLEQMVSGVNLFFRKVHLICSSSSINGYTFQSQKKP